MLATQIQQREPGPLSESSERGPGDEDGMDTCMSDINNISILDLISTHSCLKLSFLAH
jgi:hypothetical protein